jgi:transcriptional regulator with XRE-family HTH domain
MFISKNIAFLRKSKGWTQQQFADFIEVTRTAVTNYESGKAIPEFDTFLKIASKFNVTLDDFTYKNISENASLNASLHEKRGKINVEPNKKNIASEPVAFKNKGGIPLVGLRAIGGFGNGNFVIEQKDVKDYYVVPKFAHKKIDFMIEVEGSSMLPKYNSGDVVACLIIREHRFIQWNKAHVIATIDQGIIIKRVHPGKSSKSYLMVSDNKEYPPFEVPINDITGIALVVGVIRLE